ncbi:MAG: WYL domain-containing protein [candidate division Zixibacteria bacterium]|nr:WYL domain-containing protein [candidate division Zixibacteria bacterium]
MASERDLTAYLKAQPFVAFDTETTGLWAPTHRIVEIGAVRFHLESDRVETFNSLVNPQRPMPPEVIRIHGITDDMVAEAPKVTVVLKQFMEFCSDAIMVAHNAPFDISFVGCELERSQLQFSDNLILDTVDIYRRLFPGLPGYSLLQLARQFDVAQTQAHRATADAEYVCRLFRNAVARFPMIDDLEAWRSAFSVYRMQDYRSDPTVIPVGFEDLALARDEKRRVRIKYRSAGQEAAWRVVHPQALHTLGNHLYLSAHCERADAERTFRLDRIEAYELLED